MSIATTIRIVVALASFLLAWAVAAQDAAPTPAGEAAPAADAATEAAEANESAEPDQASDAIKVVEALDASLLEVLRKSNDLDYAGRFAMLQPVLAERFDLEYMARQAVGRSFLKLSEDDRKTWYSLFAHYMTANYASRFDHWAEQRFEIVGKEPGANDTVLVRTHVIEPGEKDVELSYRLRENGGRWRVVDVYLKGTISELALRRAEYSAVLKREGFAALVASIEERIKELEAGTGE